MHWVFAAMLCGLVFARWLWCVKCRPQMMPADLYRLSRHLSCIVYVCLYLVVGVREMAGVLHSHLHVVDFNPKSDLQLLFVSGLVALAFVRILAFGPWAHLGRELH